MSNVNEMWCPICKKNTTFYNVEVGVWQCDECGHIDGDTVREDSDINIEMVDTDDFDDLDEDFEVDGDFEEEDFEDEDFEDEDAEMANNSDFDELDDDFEGLDTEFDVKGKF